MKVNQLILSIYTLIVCISCEKPSNNYPEEETYLISIKEYKTNIPLAGVTLNL
jgi:hypothetical protein